MQSHQQPQRGVEEEAERPCAGLPGHREEAWEAAMRTQQQGRLAEKARTEGAEKTAHYKAVFRESSQDKARGCAQGEEMHPSLLSIWTPSICLRE